LLQRARGGTNHMRAPPTTQGNGSVLSSERCGESCRGVGSRPHCMWCHEILFPDASVFHGSCAFLLILMHNRAPLALPWDQFAVCELRTRDETPAGQRQNFLATPSPLMQAVGRRPRSKHDECPRLLSVAPGLPVRSSHGNLPYHAVGPGTHRREPPVTRHTRLSVVYG